MVNHKKLSLHEIGTLLSNRLTLSGLTLGKDAGNGILVGIQSSYIHSIISYCPLSFFPPPSIASYFTQATIDQLSTVDDFPRIRNVVVPERMFKSTRMGKNRTRAEESKHSDVSKAATSRSYGPFPTPYPYPSKGSSSMTPVFMHEPYQTTHAAEPPPTPQATYDASPSPVSPQEYSANQLPYSNQSGSQSFSSNYHRSPVSLPSPGPSYSPPKTNDIRNELPQESPSYHPSSASSSSWSHDHGYSNSPPQRLAELGASSWPLSSPLPSAFTLVNQADSAYAYSYSSHTTQSNSPHLYSTSYSMSSALGPLPSLPVPESRGGYLSPLSIPDRSQGTPSHLHERRTSPTGVLTNDSPDNFDYSLAPLNVIKRPNRYHREPTDEKTLRRLRMPQSNP